MNFLEYMSLCVPALIVVIIMLMRDLNNANKVIQSKQIDEQLKLEKYKFYTSIDIKKINDIIDDYIKDSLDLYMFETNRSLQPYLYFSDDDIREIIKGTTYKAIENMSDLYLSYISLLHKTEFDDNGELTLDSISYIRNRVKDQVILMVSTIGERRNEQ